MTDKVYTYTFKLISAETGVLISRYNDDANLIDDLYEKLLLDLDRGEEISFVNYLTLIISFLEKKEDYERCAKLLKWKNKIKEMI